MSRPYARVLVLALGSAACPAGSLAVPPNVGDWIEKQRVEGQLASAVVAHIDAAGLESSGYGSIDGANGKAPDADTQYQIGSITKVFTNLLLAERVANGTLRYDTPIGDLLPKSLEPANDGVLRVTLEALATHRSGLPRVPANLDLTNTVDPYAGYDEAKLMEGVEQARARQPLGQFYSYSNFGMGLLGNVLGHVAGDDGYRSALKSAVLEPLSLQRTGFAPDDNAALAISAGKPVPAWGFDALAGAGALWGSVGDLGRLVQAYLGTHEQSLKHDLADDLRIVAAADAFEVTRVWHVARADGQPVYWHNGGTAGFHSFVAFRPDNGRGIAVLVSGDVDPTDIGLGSLGVAPIEPVPTTVDATVFGQYPLTEQFGIGVFERDGALLAQASGQPAFVLHPVGDDWYAIGEVDASVHFVREGGKVSALELAQNGVIQTAPRSAEAAASLARQEVTLDRSALGAFVGEFAFAPGVTLSVTLSEATLRAQLTGQPAFPIFARGDDRFFYKVVDAELEFERDDTGKVSAVTLHQGGIVQRAPRQ